MPLSPATIGIPKRHVHLHRAICRLPAAHIADERSQAPLSQEPRTTVTGLAGDVSILRLGLVFVASMTGNLVFTGLPDR
jgi:hypothetical protein